MSKAQKLRVGYIRVSTKSGEQLAALESQRQRVAAAGVDEIIQDIQSGRETDRDGYQHLLEMVGLGLVGEIVIDNVDRLGRNAAETDAAIAMACRYKVTITSLKGGNIESETPTGFMMSRTMTTLAEMESRILSLRINSALKERRLRKLPLRGRAPWGYRLNEARTALEPHPLEWPRAQKFLATLALCNWRMNTALDRWAHEVNGDIPLHSCRAVKAWLINPVLRGGLGYKQQANHRFAEVVWDTHQALIDHDEFAAIERRLEANRRMWGRRSTQRQRLLTSLCRCGQCGKAMSYAGSRTIPAVVCRTRGCPQLYKSTHESLIAGAVVHTLADHAAAFAAHAPLEESPEALELKADIASLEARNDPDLQSAIDTKRARLRALPSAAALAPELLAALSDPAMYQLASYDELTELFHRFVEQVLVTNQAVERVVLRF